MLKMGCAKVDITPKFPVFLRGYGARNELSHCIEERLEAGLMVLEQGKVKLLLVTIDNLGIGVNDCDKIYADLKKATGFDASHIYLCCSHTHFAPGLSNYYVTFNGGSIPIGMYPPEKRYYDFFIKKLIEGVKEAEACVEKVEIEEAQIPVSCVSFNRRPIVKGTNTVETNYVYPKNDSRYNFQDVDRELMVWRFKAGDKLKAIIGRFSCHPVTGGNEYYGVSADYPGYFQKFVSEYFGCPGYFILGSAGDVVPMRRQGTSRKDIGCVLASAIRLAELTFHKAGEFKLSEKIIKVPLKLRVKCSRKNAQALWDAKVAECSKKKDYDEALGWIAYKHEFVNTYPTDDVELPIRLMKLGTKILVGLPFEVLTSVGKGLRKACPNTILTSVTGGYEGYLPVASEYKQGGYEATWGPRFNKTAGNEILAAAIKAVKEFE